MPSGPSAGQSPGRPAPAARVRHPYVPTLCPGSSACSVGSLPHRQRLFLDGDAGHPLGRRPQVGGSPQPSKELSLGLSSPAPCPRVGPAWAAQPLSGTMPAGRRVRQAALGANSQPRRLSPRGRRKHGKCDALAPRPPEDPACTSSGWRDRWACWQGAGLAVHRWWRGQDKPGTWEHGREARWPRTRQGHGEARAEARQVGCPDPGAARGLGMPLGAAGCVQAQWTRGLHDCAPQGQTWVKRAGTLREGC